MSLHAIKASRDGKAAVYAPSGFDNDYIPNPPTQITNVATTDLGTCNTSTN